jgi:hypothetical protein
MKSSKLKKPIESQTDDKSIKVKCQDCVNFKIDLNLIDNDVDVRTCKKCRKTIFINTINSFNSMLNSFQSNNQKQIQTTLNTAIRSNHFDFVDEPFNIRKNDVLSLESVYASLFKNENEFSFKHLVNFQRQNHFELKSKKFHISGYSSFESVSHFKFDLRKKLMEISLNGK